MEGLSSKLDWIWMSARQVNIILGMSASNLFLARTRVLQKYSIHSNHISSRGGSAKDARTERDSLSYELETVVSRHNSPKQRNISQHHVISLEKRRKTGRSCANLIFEHSILK
jgi:precorrin-6B methylase 1